MHSQLRCFVFLAAVLSPAALFAQAPQPIGAVLIATAPGKAAAERVARVTASVEAIDAANRVVTLKGPAGDLISLPVGPEVANFEQLRVGDVVAVRYFQALTLELKKHGTAARERSERVLTEAGPSGERPAARSAREVHIIADVIAVDAGTQTVTVRGPTLVVNLVVHDPAQFALVEVGDQVEAVYVEAAAISVEPAAQR